MLICPQCSAENPNRNSICQKCGASLKEHPCGQCGETVQYGEAYCPHCGAIAGRVLTVLVKVPVAVGPDGEPEQEFAPQHIKLYENCIDVGQRYQLLAPGEESTFTIDDPGNGDQITFHSRVVDCQPLQPSVLKVLLSQQGEFLAQWPQMSNGEIIAKDIWSSLNLPKEIIPYFRFPELVPKIPEVYDAWCDGDHSFLLLEDRSEWDLLVDILHDQGDSLPGLEIVFWINQLFQLWHQLAPAGWARSLLLEQNLRVDEDQNIALAQIYSDCHTEVSLEEFGHLLHGYFSPVPSAGEELLAILEKAAQGQYQNMDDLFTEIEDLVITVEEETEDFTVHEVDFEQIPEEVFAAIESSENSLSRDEGNPGSNPITMPDVNVFDSEEVDDIPTAVLPMQLISLVDAGYTDRGSHRQHNEDFFGIATSVETHRNNHGKTIRAQGIYVVCDGMGGHAAGEVASQMGVKSLLEYFQIVMASKFPDKNTIAEGISLANQKIYEVNQSNSSSGSGRMGTTLVMMLVKDTTMAIAHVGDSRIYRVTRKNGLEQLTVDHEVGQQAILNGLEPEVAYARPDAYQLTQALGPHSSSYVQPDVKISEIEEDCLILLCSDGISDNDFVEEHWQELLLPYVSSGQDVDRGLRKLMEAANEYNGHDNLTGLLVRLKVRPQIPLDVW
ncbi:MULTISPECIES: serine/threonine phosphatase [unclassified Synechocystis]|uniref:serine/threonine phosphatase n=1 Tax=unclassified Synechocystis TaxID=2640012 RepID=UPI0004019523|nr:MULTISPECIES: serine/threonine phosphatase [unclassified Synechocystis]AIE75335.1 Protein phosphatase 2C [Synechocystis sp. PCC 6714]MCT0253571.1 serine/threonine phosphatase [Synechocystis sp. CS-94]